MIGDILVRHGWITPALLARALVDQRASGLRLCSLLVSRGWLQPDDAARALAEQHGIPGVYARHLEQRDKTLAAKLSPTLARKWNALPIGTTSGGDLVVAVRDPIDAADIATAVGVPVLIAVALAKPLEQAIDEAYAAVTSDSIDIDLTETGPISLSELALVDLDDARVSKDFSQSGIAGMRGLSGAFSLPRPPTESSGSIELPVIAEPESFDEALAMIGGAGSRERAFDVAMQYAPRRWKALLVLAIDRTSASPFGEAARAGLAGPIERETARGVRGYGGHIGANAAAITVTLAEPTVLSRAYETKRVVPEIPYGDSTGPAQMRLSRLLGSAFNLSAAPVLAGPRVLYVLVAGDPIASDITDAALELDGLAAALGETCERT